MHCISKGRLYTNCHRLQSALASQSALLFPVSGNASLLAKLLPTLSANNLKRHTGWTFISTHSPFTHALSKITKTLKILKCITLFQRSVSLSGVVLAETTSVPLTNNILSLICLILSHKLILSLVYILIRGGLMSASSNLGERGFNFPLLHICFDDSCCCRQCFVSTYLAST